MDGREKKRERGREIRRLLRSLSFFNNRKTEASSKPIFSPFRGEVEQAGTTHDQELKNIQSAHRLSLAHTQKLHSPVPGTWYVFFIFRVSKIQDLDQGCAYWHNSRVSVPITFLPNSNRTIILPR